MTHRLPFIRPATPTVAPTALLAAALIFVSPAAFAANVFVASAQGSDLSFAQRERITNMVRRSVENMPENKLVFSESEADFVLRPAIIQKENGPILRIEKSKEKSLLAVAEQPIDVTNSIANAQTVTQQALQNDSAVNQASAQPAPTLDAARDAASVSGSTSPASSQQESSNDSQASQAQGEAAAVTATTSNLTAQDADGSESRTPATQPSSTAGTLPSLESENIPESKPQQAATETKSDAGSAMSSSSPASGDVRAPSPRLANQKHPSFFQMGIGPSFPIGLNSDNVLYDISGAYNYNIDDQWTVKGFGDFNIGTGADAAQFVNLGVAGELYPKDWPTFGNAKPYVQGDLGYGFARSGRNPITNGIGTGDGVTIGGGAGFKFEAAELNWDIAAHYSLLTSQIDQRTPSVLGIKAALNF